MDTNEEHPEDAFELGKVAAARLRAHNQHLSDELPAALQTLFNDAEFREAIVVSGVVTNRRQSLTPVASYQVAGSSASSSSFLESPRKRVYLQGPPAISSEEESPTRRRTRRSSRSVTPAAKSDTSSPVAKLVPVVVDQGFGGSSVVENVPFKPFCQTDVENTVVEECETVEVETEGATIEDRESYFGNSTHPQTRTDHEEPEPEEVETNCVSCGADLEESSRIISSEHQKHQLYLRDMLWLSLGMKKLYNRSSSEFPFCVECKARIQTMFEISHQIKKLEEQFDEVRSFFVKGIVERHICKSNAGRACSTTREKDNLTEKIARKLQRECSGIHPGKSLLNDVEALTNTNTNGHDHDEDEGQDHNQDVAQTEKPKFECRICDATFISERSRNLHERSHNTVQDTPPDPDPVNYACDQCEKSFPSQSRLKRHQLSHNPTTASFQCTYCDKIFTSKSNLNEHVLRHKGLKRFECSICSEKCFNMRQVRNHVAKRHPGRDPMKTMTRLKPSASQ